MTLNYLDDMMDGVQVWFHPNGQKAKEVELRLYVPHGYWKEWDENGVLIVDEEYEDGATKEKKDETPKDAAPSAPVEEPITEKAGSEVHA